MNSLEFQSVIKFVLHTSNSIDNRNTERLNRLATSRYFSLRDIRFVYRTAIDSGVFPECPWCKTAITDSDTLTLDHTFPKSKGGSDDITNIQPMHRKCNEVKGDIINNGIKYEIKIHTKLHSRSNAKKIHRRINRNSVISTNNEQELLKQCEKADKIKYNLHKGNSGKHR